MSKKILSAMVVISILITALVAFNPFSTKKVSAEEYRGGFSLTPSDSDSTGVNPNSSFVLKSQSDVTTEDVQNNLSIKGEPAPVITEISPNTFLIAPAAPFRQNALITFLYGQESGSDISWTFQTSAAFRIINVFPGNESSGVPTDSGIEIYFSHDNYEDIDKYFEITPSVSGRFERHKKAAVFVPKGLKESTLYTVRLKKGLKLKDSNAALEQDYVFMFETAANESAYNDQYDKGYFSYNTTMNEFPPPGDALSPRLLLCKP